MSGNSSGGSSPDRPLPGAVIVAAGSGRRMGGVRKQYLEILGEPVLLRAIRPFLEHPGVGRVVVVLPEEDVAVPPEWLAGLPLALVAGGAERGDSVWNGLSALEAGTPAVLIHDGARPFVDAALIDRVMGRVSTDGGVGAVPVVAVTDTIKEVDGEGRVIRTARRERLRRAQTPQGFPLSMLREAYERARAEGWNGTDDASLCERFAFPVFAVEGDRDNLKITQPADLADAEVVARRVARPPGRSAETGR